MTVVRNLKSGNATMLFEQEEEVDEHNLSREDNDEYEDDFNDENQQNGDLETNNAH